MLADTANFQIVNISVAGDGGGDGNVVSLLAGGNSAFPKGGFADGMTSSALFNNPYGVALDKLGNAYIAGERGDGVALISLPASKRRCPRHWKRRRRVVSTT